MNKDWVFKGHNHRSLFFTRYIVLPVKGGAEEDSVPQKQRGGAFIPLPPVLTFEF